MENTPFPAGFAGGDSLLLYFWALGSITALAVLTAMTGGMMVRDLWRDRYICHPRHPVTAFRLIILLCSFTGFMRALPEAAYLYLWNEVRADQWELILMIKRLADGLAIIPGATWTTLLALAYPSICHALKTNAHYAPNDLLSPWPRIARPALALLLAFVIAFLVAISKLYMGEAGGAR